MFMIVRKTEYVGLFVAVNRVDFTMFNGLTAAANELLASLAPR